MGNRYCKVKMIQDETQRTPVPLSTTIGVVGSIVSVPWLSSLSSLLSSTTVARVRLAIFFAEGDEVSDGDGDYNEKEKQGRQPFCW